MPTLSVKPAPISKKAVIVISMPYKANSTLLNSLSSGCYLGCSSNTALAPQTILLHCMCKLFEYKLGATALDAQRGKFTRVRVSSHRGHAIFSLDTEPTFSAVRKVLTVVSKNFTPEKLLPLYKKYAQLLDVKVELPHYNYAVDEVVRAAKQIAVFVTGTVRLPEGGHKLLLDCLAHAAPRSAGKSETPKSSPAVATTPHPVDCGSKLDTFLVQQLLQGMQIESRISDGMLVPITGTTKWETIKGKVDGDRIKRFVELKLLKLGEKLPLVMLLMCADTGYFTADELAKLPASYTAATLTSALKKHF